MKDLTRLLNPKTIAVVGGTIAERVMGQLDKIGYTGDVWPVHPTKATMAGRLCYPTLADLPAVPDAAYLSAPRDATIDAIGQLSRMGAGGAVCYAAGFAEAGEAKYQQRLEAALGEMPLIGPNCYGVLNYLDGVTLWPDDSGGKRIERGVALIGQSGNIMISLSMQQRGVPLGYLISTGNQTGLTIPDYLHAMLADERVTAIGLHIEGLKDVVAFSEAALAALRQKVPLVVLKTGASEIGEQVTLSHTSSLAGADALYDALFARYGVVRVQTIPQLLETLKFLSVVGPLPSRRIASISCSGGEAALVADTAVSHNLTFPKLTAQQEKGLSKALGERVSLSNPLDYHTYIWGDKAAQKACFSAMVQGEQAVTLKIIDFPRPDVCDLTDWQKAADAFVDAVTAHGVRGAVVATMQENLPEFIADRLMAQGISPMMGLDECLQAVAGAADVYAGQRHAFALQPLPRPSAPSGTPRTLNEFESKQLLAQFGIAVPQGAICGVETAVFTANQIGYPVAVKLLSDQIVHKSDVGGVHVGIEDDAQLVATIAHMAHLGTQFLIEAMQPKPLAELILGITRDPQFGLVLLIGAGGVLVELFQDSQTLLFPVRRNDIATALDALKIAPLLNGYRGQPPADKATLLDTIVNFATFAEAHADSLMEVDVNPVFVYERGITAVDAVIRMAHLDI